VAHVKHPKVMRDRIVVRVQLPDPRIRHVLVVETKMPMTRQDAGFDEDEFSALVEAVRAGMDRTNADEAEIVAG
jgi:hypothetical protein